MSQKATVEDDYASDSEQAAQNDDELSSLLEILSTSEHARSQIASHNFRIMASNPEIVSRMLPKSISAVVVPLLRLENLISHQAVIMNHVAELLTAWIKAHPKEITVIAAGVTLFALSLATPAILGSIGFSATGPVLGSMAAGWQASVGSVAAGSLFSFLQSAAMGGAAMGLFTGVGAVGAAIAVGGGLATVENLKQRCGDFMKKATTFVTSGQVVKEGEGETADEQPITIMKSVHDVRERCEKITKGTASAVIESLQGAKERSAEVMVETAMIVGREFQNGLKDRYEEIAKGTAFAVAESLHGVKERAAEVAVETAMIVRREFQNDLKNRCEEITKGTALAVAESLHGAKERSAEVAVETAMIVGRECQNVVASAGEFWSKFWN